MQMLGSKNEAPPDMGSSGGSKGSSSSAADVVDEPPPDLDDIPFQSLLNKYDGFCVFSLGLYCH